MGGRKCHAASQEERECFEAHHLRRFNSSSMTQRDHNLKELMSIPFPFNLPDEVKDLRLQLPCPPPFIPRHSPHDFFTSSSEGEWWNQVRCCTAFEIASQEGNGKQQAEHDR
ncbi:hypothetical protein B296_00054533 [Ensete ventricosum]|uniref:Uncharacterized protein n=1 Tax=Ensete ventricosum TaxID=4639 RepID=A0A426XIM1_ENSVE|nr:hypothetical protein B296_00054533 [Ensete ventricosum]